MTNIITFPKSRARSADAKPVKAKAKGKPKATAIAPDAPCFYSSLDVASKIAGYIYGDMEAVDLLLAEQRRWLERKQGFGYLPFEIRKRCAKYLIENEDHQRDFNAMLKVEIGA